MTRRLMVHLIALLLGGGLGVVAGNWAESEKMPSVAVAGVVVACVFMCQVIAMMMTERMSRPRVRAFKETTLRGSEAWGWLKPVNNLGAAFPLSKECVRIGRGVEMDIMLNNSSISRRHAEVRRMTDGCIICDAGSRNGIFVNDARVQEQFVSDGDQIALGELKFQFLRSVGTPRHGVLADLEARREDGDREGRSETEVHFPDANRVDVPEADPLSKTTDLESARARRRRVSRPFDNTAEYDRHEEDED